MLRGNKWNSEQDYQQSGLVTLKQSYKEATFQTHFLFLSQVQNCTIFCQKTCLSSK